MVGRASLPVGDERLRELAAYGVGQSVGGNELKRGPLFPYIELLGCNSRALMFGLADLQDREDAIPAPPRRSSSSSP